MLLLSRWLFSTLIASQHAARHRPTALFGDYAQPNVGDEEYKALAGVWRADLQLDQGSAEFSLHLTAVGKVYPMGDQLSSICHNWKSAQWHLERAYSDYEDPLCLFLKLGNLQLEGRGERGDSLRCKKFSGVVHEGDDSDCIVVGSFSMQLSLPICADAAALEERYRRRDLMHASLIATYDLPRMQLAGALPPPHRRAPSATAQLPAVGFRGAVAAVALYRRGGAARQFPYRAHR